MLPQGAPRPLSKRMSKFVEHQRMLLKEAGNIMVARYYMRLRYFFGPQHQHSHVHFSVDCSRIWKRKTLLCFFLQEGNVGGWAPPQVRRPAQGPRILGRCPGSKFRKQGKPKVANRVL